MISAKPVLQYRDWHNNLLGCDEIDSNLLFVTFPKGGRDTEHPVFEIEFLHANLGGLGKCSATYNGSVFLVNSRKIGRYETDHLDCQGWAGSPLFDKWSARWSKDQHIWLVTHWQE